MTERIKYSTAYIHEFAAKIEEMVFSGYRVDHTSAFCARRRGSAYEIHFIPTREVVDFDDYFPWTEEEERALSKLYEEMAEKRVAKSCGAEKTCKSILDAAFANLDKDEDCNHIDRKAVDELNQLTIQQKWEAEEALNELAAQSQELGMYGKDNGIFDRLVESMKSAQSNPEGCVSTIVEVDKERFRVYSKSELENMEWSEFKKLIDAAGIRGRRRQNLTRDYLIYQEENLK